MGSVDMAFNKILSVLLVAGSAWTNPQNNFFNFNDFATQRPIAPSPTVSTTPVPILRYVDTHNKDNKVSTPTADSNNPGPSAVFLQDRRASDQYNQLQLLQLVELVILLSATLI